MQITMYCLYIRYCPKRFILTNGRQNYICFYNEASSRILQVQNPPWHFYYLRAPAGIFFFESWRWVWCTALRHVWKGNTLRWCLCGNVGQNPGWSVKRDLMVAGVGPKSLSPCWHPCQEQAGAEGCLPGSLSWQCGRGQWCWLKLKDVMLTAGQHLSCVPERTQHMQHMCPEREDSDPSR